MNNKEFPQKVLVAFLSLVIGFLLVVIVMGRVGHGSRVLEEDVSMTPAESGSEDEVVDDEIEVEDVIEVFENPDEWEQIIGDGFGYSVQDTVPEMEVFEGYLYAATSPTEKALAKLWRSETGEVDSWEEIVDFTPALDRVVSIHSFGSTDLGGGYMWFGTGAAYGATIYRSQDGLSWTQINEGGFGTPDLKGATPHMVVFQGYLYAGAISHGSGIPSQVWRIPYVSSNASEWELVVDFADINPIIDTVTYFYVWNDTLYFGTNAGAQLWESTDGVNFTQNEYVGNGFGDSSNQVLSSFVEFNDYFYVTTTNMKGGQLWRTNDGEEWEQLTDDAFGKGRAVSELRSLRTSFGLLWLTSYTDTTYSEGTAIWRSSDGVNFVQSNVDGFGDINNNGQNAVTIGFENHQYFGGPNYQDGGQIWRALMD
jgi:hypothetical protein